jgi:hypothetical protein
VNRRSSKTRGDVLDKTDGHCWYCSTLLKPYQREVHPLRQNRNYCIDHAVPRSTGGSDEFENLVPSCWICNNRKGDMTIEEFRQLISQYHGLAVTRRHAEYRRKRFGFGDYTSRLVFFFETLETSDEEELKKGARLFFFRDPTYLTQRDDRSWRRHCRERGLPY